MPFYMSRVHTLTFSKPILASNTVFFLSVVVTVIVVVDVNDDAAEKLLRLTTAICSDI